MMNHLASFAKSTVYVKKEFLQFVYRFFNSNFQVVDDLIKKFNLQEADKTVHSYSGGMKRKLSVAMAMIGEPPIVMLVSFGKET